MALMGAVNNNLAATLVKDIDAEFVIRSVHWFEKLLKIDNNLGAGSFALIEIMQEVFSSNHLKLYHPEILNLIYEKGAFNSSENLEATAWPHHGRRHILQLATGTLPGSSSPNEVALNLLQTAPSEIDLAHEECDYTPNFIESYNDLRKV